MLMQTATMVACSHTVFVRTKPWLINSLPQAISQQMMRNKLQRTVSWRVSSNAQMSLARHVGIIRIVQRMKLAGEMIGLHAMPFRLILPARARELTARR